jgi:cytochrome c-type biogenesis protein CcmE
MTRKQTRLTFILAALCLLSLAVGLIMFGLRDSIVFFYTPSEIGQKHVASGTHIRLGGLVENGSLVKGADGQVTFNITDHTKTMQVTYKGLLPDLFREGQGVVTEGITGPDGIFKADVVLAKHDEKYMPKEVVDKLKAQGEWRPE